MATSPNILFIMADQLTGAAMPMNGRTVVKTPHLTALANEGVNFSKAYCNNPICAPSRASMLTGLLASRIGAYDNGASFSSEVPTLAHYLSAMGYSTTLSGKMHFVGPDQLHGYEERLTTDIYPSDYGWTADWTVEGHPYAPSVMSLRGVVEAGVCARSMQVDHDEEVTATVVQKIYDLARVEEKKPFFLTASLTHPHNPYTVPQEFYDMYTDEEIDMPTVGPIPLEKMDPWSKRFHSLIRADEHDVSPENVRKARRSYYATVSYIDNCVGRMFTALKKSGLDENTIIIFTSDHGDMLGERGLWYKFNPFEWSIRIPMIIRTPDCRKGSAVTTPVSLLDLTPTLLGYAESKTIPTHMEQFEGKSLRPLLTGKGSLHRECVPIEFTAEGVCAPALILVGEEYKYIYCETDPPMMFNLAKDPHELNNLAGKKEYEAIENNVLKQLHNLWDPKRLREDILTSQARRLFLQRQVLQDSNQPEWDYQVRKDATQQYVRSRKDPSTAMSKSRARLPYVPPTPPDNPRND
ncbi:choline-sulfatase [Desulfovibrio cuneatus]|uniref:choline-sulfatase n=1 Tax=Desulfovibrio cuneatus TaxID=159728 RepID=UPI00040A0672|nr:choline-sulfatase [Desulfovibrio cuneatus]